MIGHIQTYFQAEKSECLLFIIIGIVALVAGVYFLLRGTSFQKGMAYPLIAIALIQAGVGGGVYLRTDKQVSELITIYNSSPAEFKARELPRMEVVNKNFDVYKVVEIALLLIGAALVLFLRGREFWFGVGSGLALQSAILLVLDFIAESRADVYTSHILRI